MVRMYRRSGWYRKSEKSKKAHFWSEDQSRWTASRPLSELEGDYDVESFSIDPEAGIDPPRRGRAFGFAWTLLVVMLGGVAFAIWWNTTARPSDASSNSGGGSDALATYSSTVSVVYEVEGTATGTNVTLESATGTVQMNDKAVPLGNRSAGTVGFHVTMPRGHVVSLLAQNTGDSGSITCKISVDGVVVSSNTSSGGYAIAMCSGTAQ